MSDWVAKWVGEAITVTLVVLIASWFTLLPLIGVLYLAGILN